jgi:nitroreductase
VNLHLSNRDKKSIAILSLVFLLLSILGWQFWGGVVSIVSLAILFCFLLALQIEMYRRQQNRIREVSKRHLVTDITEVIQSRQSVRKFVDTPVLEKDIMKMLESARMAPSGGNSQPWHFFVVRDRETIKRMERLIAEKIEELSGILKKYSETPQANAGSQIKAWSRSSLFFAEAALVVAVLVKNIPYLYPKPCVRYVMDKKGLNECEARTYMGSVEMMSVSAAVENLILSAHALGYGSCWLRVPFMAKDDLMHLFGVRPPWDLVALVPIGYPDPRYPLSKVGRKEIKDIATFV